MTDERNPENISQVWQRDDADAVRLSVEELRARIDRVGRRSARRTIGGVIAAAIGLTGFWYVWSVAAPTSMLTRAGVVLSCLGTGFLVFQLLRHADVGGALRTRMVELGAAPSVHFHRWQLERQRDFHSGWRLWLRLLLLTPGPLLFFLGFAGEHPEVARTVRLEMVSVVVLALLAIPINLRLARRYRHELEDLNRLL